MTVAALTGLIPVVVAGGIVLKFADAALPKPQRSRRTSRRRSRRSSRSQTGSGIGFGDFSNSMF